MLPNRLHELRDPSSWDGKLVHYVPYVGENYSDGLINGVRLLLVGSHTMKMPVCLSKKADFLR